MKTVQCLLCLLLVHAAAALPVAEERVHVRRGHWPVIISPLPGMSEAAEVCRALEPEDIEFSWGGERVEVTAIGPRPLPRLHALLIDTSDSMNESLGSSTRFDEAKQAAIEYIDGVPDGESILIASFNESMVLGTPPTRDKERARQAVGRFKASYYTALWDSLGYLAQYLDSLPGEKVIALLTDGDDLGSIKWSSFEEVTELAATSRNLSVFPIGLGVPREPASQTRSWLGALARQTGGEFFEIKQGERLSGLFRKILRRLENRVYLSYVPEERRPGRVRVHVRSGVPCRIRSLGSSRWSERRHSPLSTSAVAPTGADLAAFPGFVEALDCVSPGRRQEAAAKLAATDNPLLVEDQGGTSLFAILASGEAILGYAKDLLQERGPLFDGKVYRNTGRLRIDLKRVPLAASRELAILTPPLAFIRDRLGSPEDLLLYLLENGMCAPSEEGPAPFLVHGRTFLDLREPLGRALFLAREDYRAWTSAKIEEEVEAALRVLLAAWPEAEPPTRDEQRQLHAAMTEQALGTAGRTARLAGWLGDLNAGEVIRSLEERLINDLLAGDSDGVEMAAASWRKLGEWFPPALDRRIVTPLVPAYDPTREAVGFYRFVLPRPEAHGPQPLPLPDRPLALLAVERLLELPEAAASIPGRVRVTEVSYQRASRQEIRDAGCGEQIGKKKAGLKVVVTLDDGGRIVAHYPSDLDGDAICLRVEAAVD
jgi:hypothetical protein